MRRGRASLVFEHPPVIEAAASVAGKKEGEGPLRGRFDLVAEDDRMGKKTWEEAESAMQEAACRLALKKGGLERGQIQYLFAGDLLGQLIATSFGVADLEIPLFGLYGACSTIGEALCLGAMTVAAGVRGAGAHRVLQPFCHGGETVPVSPGLREPETLVLHLDGNRERRLRAGVGGGGRRRSPGEGR